MTSRSSLFTYNRVQTVWLPNEVAFPESVREVDIVAIGQSRVISPRGRRWDDLFLRGLRASGDFMTPREKAAAEEREPL